MVLVVILVSPEDEILSKVQKSKTPICFQGGILIQLEILVILLGLVFFIVEILKYTWYGEYFQIRRRNINITDMEEEEIEELRRMPIPRILPNLQ